jgi:hypothetical protein
MLAWSAGMATSLIVFGVICVYLQFVLFFGFLAFRELNWLGNMVSAAYVCDTI